MSETPNPNQSLELVIKDSDLPSLTKEYSELALDSVLDDGLLKDIPFVSTVIGAIKFGNSINKQITTKKLYKFLFELKSVSTEQRSKKIEEINASKKYQASVGEMILETLEKIESEGKPEVIGKLFKSFIEEKIDFQTYLRLVHIVKNVFYYDLLLLLNHDEHGYLYEGNSEELSSSGLSSYNINAWGKSQPKENCSGEITPLGKVLVQSGFW